ncbi:hypothetical protein B9Z55_003323 [Caenorhabditis nigoni]|uniref:Sdz-33 F-box domain-containing protein n=1 Tax=Caenorhabditis nigoni TaxID=1611254 RepID=A0A2G5VQ02_9PELO|nr:hypothetical protein B9Z55_003323 [Caenorhabditis nigoni]
MPFPILRTSFVVLSEIISLLEPNEIVTASFCSKKVRCLLKKRYQQRKPSKWRLLMIDYQSVGKVNIVTSGDGKQMTVLTAKHISVLQGHTLKYINGYKRAFSSQCPVLYFNDLTLGLKMIVDYVADLLSLVVHVLVIDRNGTWTFDWIENRQEKMLQSFAWIPQKNSMADEQLLYVLRNARVSYRCIIADKASDNFKFNEKLGPMRELIIQSNGHWVTCDNLMNFDSIEITVRGSRLSVSDLNSFLRHWRAGGSARLELLNVKFEKHTFRERFDEDLEVVRTDEERVFRRMRYVFLIPR